MPRGVVRSRRHRAEQLAEDPDGRFLFLWIAFNAAYATEIDERFRLSEQQTFRGFLVKLTQLDAGRKRFEALACMDSFVPIEGSGLRTRRAVLGSKLVTVSGAPHGLNLSHAQAFNDALLSFLRG